jgi:hypothetical protein
MAEKQHRHHWDFGTPTSRARWSNPARRVFYNFNPVLDQDILDSHKNYKNA